MELIMSLGPSTRLQTSKEKKGIFEVNEDINNRMCRFEMALIKLSIMI